MADHTWVSLSYTPVEVKLEDNGNLTVQATEAAIDASVEGALFGCWFCHTPLNAETFGTECTGQDDSNQAML